MFQITNLSNNPLKLADGKSLAPRERRAVKAVGDAEKKYESRGWLSIIEEPKPEPKPEPKTAGGNADPTGGKK